MFDSIKALALARYHKVFDMFEHHLTTVFKHVCTLSPAQPGWQLNIL